VVPNVRLFTRGPLRGEARAHGSVPLDPSEDVETFSGVEMRSLLIQGEVDAAGLAGLLPSVGATVQTAVSYAFGNTRIALYVGRKFTFRSNDYLGILLLAASDGTSQRIDVSYAGGGAGFLGAVWGAGRDLEDNLIGVLADVLASRSLQYSEIRPEGGG